jgi:hypothetical protein
MSAKGRPDRSGEGRDCQALLAFLATDWGLTLARGSDHPPEPDHPPALLLDLFQRRPPLARSGTDRREPHIGASPDDEPLTAA